MEFIYEHEGQRHLIQLTPHRDGGLTVTIDGVTREAEAFLLPDGGWRIVLDGQSSVVYTAAAKEQRFASLGGRAYALTVPDQRDRPRRSAARGGDLTAPMPAQVVEVCVAPGDPVKRGQTLVILEAMKMEIRVSAPGDGLVRELLVSAGQVVERGQRLLELLAAEPSG